MRAQTSIAFLGLACLLACRTDETASQVQPLAKIDPVETSARPSLSITRIGPEDVQERSRIDLPEATVEMAGKTWNFDPNDEMVALYRTLGPGPWTVAAASSAEPGGVFVVSGIRFPDVGDYEVIAGLVRTGNLAPGGRIPQTRLRTQVRALSRKLVVRVTAPPVPLNAERPALAVVSVEGRALDLDPLRATLVPAQGNVVLRAVNARPETQVYLVIFAPASGSAYLHGPAQRTLRNEYILPGISLKIPADPRNVQLELIAVASNEPLSAGPINLAWLRRPGIMLSSSAGVVIDAGDSLLVPHIAITKIGAHTLDGREAPSQPLQVETGDSVEVGQFERVPEGALLWILTRPRESSRWLAQGPALLSGLSSADDPEQGPPGAVWVWPSTRFEREKPVGEAQRSEMAEEFEVRAVLSTKRLPVSWIDSSFLAGQTVSNPLRVSTRPREPLPLQKIFITRIGDTDADPEKESVVGAMEGVEVDAHQELPPPFRIYLAWRPRGYPLWTLVEAIPQGRSHVVPALSFASSPGEEGGRYELMAVVTRGEMPEEQIRYKELAGATVARSDVFRVRSESKALATLLSQLLPLNRSWEKPGTSRGPKNQGKNNMWTWLWFLPLLLFLLVLAGLILLERRHSFVEPLARRAADRIDRAVKSIEERLTQLPPTRPALFFLGVMIAIVLLFVIIRYYLPLYAKAVAVVTNLQRSESEGLAVWLIFLTALAGIFLELTADPEYGFARDRVWLRVVLGMSLGLILIGLTLFQALFYYTFLSKTAEGMIPVLGGIAFFLIAFVEAMAFFFVTRLTLPQAEAITLRFFRLINVSWALFFRAIAGFFGEISKRDQNR